MTTNPFGLHGQVWLPFRLGITRRLASLLAVIICLLSVSGCFTGFRPTGPVLYKPSCDLSPVLRLHFPEQINTLSGVPRSETIVENGINKNVGGRQPDEIKEWFNFTEGATEYTFIVYYSDAAAMKEYKGDSERHVFREITENGLIGRVHYTEEPRADPEGGSGPMGVYISRADFRLHNLYIRVETKAHVEEGEKPQNDKLTNAVKHLGQMLGGTLGPNTRNKTNKTSGTNLNI